MSEDFNKIIIKTGFFILLLNIFGKGAGYVFNMLLTKSFSTEIYGVFSLAWGVVTVSIILLLGIPEATSRFIAFYRGKEDKEKIDDSLRTGTFLILILTFIAFLILFILYKFFPEFLSLNQNEFLLVCLLFSIRSLQTFFNFVISGFRKPHISRVITFFLEILRPIFIFLLILLGISLSIFNVISVLILSILLPSLFAVFYVIKKFGFKGKFNLNLSKEFFKFGIPITLTSTAHSLLGWADMFMIKYFLGFSALGIYYIANLTAAIELIFFSAFLAMFSPIITEQFGKRNFEKISQLSSNLLKKFIIFIPIIFLPLLIFPKEILTILFTPEYAEGALALQIMCISMFLYGLSNLFSTILTSSGNPQKVTKIVVLASIVNVIANFILIPKLGIEGAAIATIFSSFLLCTLTYLEVKKLKIL